MILTCQCLSNKSTAQLSPFDLQLCYLQFHGITDSCATLAEETKGADIACSWAILMAIGASALAGWAMLLAMLFSIQVSRNALLRLYCCIKTAGPQSRRSVPHMRCLTITSTAAEENDSKLENSC